MIKLSEKVLQDEAAMRAFYRSVGVSAGTTELAIAARRQMPIVPRDSKAAPKGRKRKARPR